MGNLNRRQFLKKSGLTVVMTSTCLCGLGGCATITKIGDTPAIDPASFTLTGNILTIDLTRETALSKVGGSVKVKHADIPDGIIVAHVDTGRFEIASLLCTHRGVEVEYDHPQNNFQCASLGGSRFTMDGHRVSGPAEKPLKSYDAVLNDRNLVIRL